MTEQNFQETVEASMTAPVVLVFHSSSQSPESGQYADEVAAAAAGYEGRFLVGVVDVDAAPGIAQALQITQVPLMLVLLDGRPVTQPLPGAMQPDELNTLFNQLGQQLTAQGVTGRHQPRGAAAPAEAEGDETNPRSTRGTPPRRPRSRPTTSTARWRSTRSSSTPTPPTPRPPPGWRWPRCCSAPRAWT